MRSADTFEIDRCIDQHGAGMAYSIQRKKGLYAASAGKVPCRVLSSCLATSWCCSGCAPVRMAAPHHLHRAALAGDVERQSFEGVRLVLKAQVAEMANGSDARAMYATRRFGTSTSPRWTLKVAKSISSLMK